MPLLYSTLEIDFGNLLLLGNLLTIILFYICHMYCSYSMCIYRYCFKLHSSVSVLCTG